MTSYRPSEALCHWRHLSVIVVASNINGTPVDADDMTALKRAEMIAGCQNFTQRVAEYSQGMCWLQHDIVWYPGTWTEGTDIGGGAYVVTRDQVAEGMLEVGVRTDGYDSYFFHGPAVTLGSGANGLSYADATTRRYYSQIEYYLTDQTDDIFQADVQIHEFGHLVDFYFDEYGLDLTMPHPDAPQNYRRINNTALDPNDLSADFLRAMFTGDIEDIATSTAQGATAAVWALGPPRKTYPR